MLSQPVQVTLICLMTLLKSGILELEEPIRGERVCVLESPERTLQLLSTSKVVPCNRIAAIAYLYKLLTEAS